MSDSLIGKTLKDFEVIDLIGQGGMAAVYRARQRSVNRDIALKVIDLTNDEHGNDFPQRFEQEAKVVASLEHIHILPIHDYGLVGNQAFIAMRLLRGGTLQDMLKAGPLDLNYAADLFRQFSSGLAYAHSHGVIHRDLKPSNIMLDDTGNAYITDFGLAKITDRSLNLTQNDRIVGTPNYMAPEQLKSLPITSQADIYSLGVVLYEMVVGQLPYGKSSTSDLISRIYQVLEQPPEPPRKINPEIPVEVEKVILKALEKDPDKRFRSPDEMAKALLSALGRANSSSSPTLYQSQPTLNFSKLRKSQNRWFWVAVIVVIVGLVAIGGFIILSNDSADTAEPEELVLTEPTILVGEQGVPSQIKPTEEDIRRAQQYLGEDGFVAFMACNQTSEYHATYARELRDFLAGYDLEMTVYDADSDAYQQLTQLERARTDGATAMIICNLDTTLLKDSLSSAQRAGIRMVFVHAMDETFGGVSLTGDNYQLGYVPGKYAGQLIQAELAGQAKVIILDFPDLPEIVIRANGLEDGMLELAPEAEVIGRYKGATQDFAYESVKKLLEDGIEFQVILSINDAGSYGAIKALEEAGYSGDEIIIASVDAENLAQDYIREGHFIRGSVAGGRTESAQAAADAMVKLLAGGTTPEQILTAPGELVTRESLEATPESTGTN